MPYTWTDDPLITNETRIRAVHIEELRNAIDDLNNACLSDDVNNYTPNDTTVQTSYDLSFDSSENSGDRNYDYGFEHLGYHYSYCSSDDTCVLTSNDSYKDTTNQGNGYHCYGFCTTAYSNEKKGDFSSHDCTRNVGYNSGRNISV